MYRTIPPPQVALTPQKLAEDLFIPANEFVDLPIPPRRWLAEGALPHPSLGMLYAYRGVGKTMVTFDLALALAVGRPWLGCAVPQPYNVLYIDGEMPRADMIDRLRRQCAGAGHEVPSRLAILSAEELALRHMNINFAEEKSRVFFEQAIVHWEQRWELSMDVIIIDNWTSLIRGIDENDNSQMDAIKSWLIRLRHAGISVVLVHHAGKSGKHQRGGSAREDVLDYSMRLERGVGGETKFIWDKVRGARPDPDEFYLAYEQDDRTIKLDRQKDGKPKPANYSWGEKICAHISAQGPTNFMDLLEIFEIPKSSLSRALSYLISHQKIHKLPSGEFEID